MSEGHPLRGPLLVLAGALCFSTSGFTQALAPEDATPYIIGALRMLIGGLGLLIWCIWRGTLPRRKGWPIKNVLLSILGLLGCQLFFFKGILLNGVAVGTVATIGSMPIASALLGRIFLDERPARAWYPATAIAILGLVLLNWHGATGVNPLALGLPLLAGLSYTTYLVFSKELARRHNVEGVMMILCLLSGICLLPLFLSYPGAWIFTPKGMAVSLYLGLVTSALAFSITLAGLRTTPTATAATLNLAEPVSAALLGIVGLHEPAGTSFVAGISCIIASTLILICCTPRMR
ncbi:MAG: EamA family transporter [Betaproteobacteria bacterium]|nr:EamA family transporter [Betaproteobacteria bacterium]